MKKQNKTKYRPFLFVFVLIDFVFFLPPTASVEVVFADGYLLSCQSKIIDLDRESSQNSFMFTAREYWQCFYFRVTRKWHRIDEPGKKHRENRPQC